MSNKIIRIVGLDLWGIGAIVLGILVVLPILAVFALALNPSGDIWQHLISTSLRGYISTTLLLMTGVCVIVLGVGVLTAWLITMCDFPGRKIFEWLLLLPLAIPTYVIAYAYTDFLEYAGPLQGLLRYVFGWVSPKDYWFPEIRSLEGAIFVMGFVLYPYVYLLTRSAFLEQSVNVLEVSRTLGNSPVATFFLVCLPSARPAIAVGVMLALMETINDYGTVDFFAVSTLTAGIIDVWLGMGNLAGGAQIALMLFSVSVVLIFFERYSRKQRKTYQQSESRFKKLPRYRLKGRTAFFALVSCVLPIFFGFVLPVVVLADLALENFSNSWSLGFFDLIVNSLTLSLGSAVLTVAIAIFLIYARRISGKKFLRIIVQMAGMGYAIPGAVLAVGIIVPLAIVDNSIDSWLRENFFISSGLMLSGTVFALLFAYSVRFLTIALGQIESSIEKISPSMDMAARSLGNTVGQVLMRFHLPLMRGGVLTALILVFVDCMKELPATLLLRPLNFETLATHVYHYASDEMLGEAALGCLTIVLVGLLPVLILSGMIANSRNSLPKQI